MGIRYLNIYKTSISIFQLKPWNSADTNENVSSDAGRCTSSPSAQTPNSAAQWWNLPGITRPILEMWTPVAYVYIWIP